MVKVVRKAPVFAADLLLKLQTTLQELNRDQWDEDFVKNPLDGERIYLRV